MAGLASLALAQDGVPRRGSDDARLVAIARAAVESEVRGAAPPSIGFRSCARPVFVTIEVAGTVRGCRGDLTTRTQSLEEEVALAARAAATHDPRYRPLSPAELSKFLVTVTVVSRTEPLGDVRSLTPEDGLILRSNGRTGIVLPWEGKDPLVRLDWAYRKAGVGRGASVVLDRLVATRVRG